jgi:hypothetical protein
MLVTQTLHGSDRACSGEALDLRIITSYHVADELH